MRLGYASVTIRFVSASVRKAVFPAAGLGTRFLPATKAQPKEMLPLVDKPIIQYGVEEAVASGVDNIILVTGRGKNAIEDHFDVSVELESFLEARGKREQLAEVRKISNLINFAYVRQGEPLGLGHAVLVTRELLKSRPIYACQVKGVRHDTGNKLGFLKAVVYFALRRPDLADKFSTYLASLNLPTPIGKR